MVRVMRYAVLPALLLAATAAWADARNFTLQNNTGRTVMQLFISPANEQAWEEDLLGSDVLPDEGSAAINFEADERDECVYDLKIVHDDGDSAIWPAVNLCAVTVVSVMYNDSGQPEASAE